MNLIPSDPITSTLKLMAAAEVEYDEASAEDGAHANAHEDPGRTIYAYECRRLST